MTTPEGVIWYSGTTKVTGTLKASAGTEYTIYLVPCKHTAEETQKGYDEYLTIKNSAGAYVWEVLGNTRDLDLSNYVTLDTDQSISGHKTFDAGFTTTALATFNGSAEFKEDLILACPLKINNSAGAEGQVLTSQGAGKAPQWTTLSIPQGTVKKFVQEFTGTGAQKMFSFSHGLSDNNCTVTLYEKASGGGTEYEVVMADITLSRSMVYIYFAQAPSTSNQFKVVVTG